MTDDPVRTYTPEEQRTLTERLRELTSQVHRGETRGRPLDLPLLRDLHAALFRDVRSHAGRIRSPGFGSEYLTFGPHRSSHRSHVERELKVLFARVERHEREIETLSGDDRDLVTIRLAVRTHAEIIRVHPFEDGNGRTSRLCANHLLVRLGLRPIAIETVRQEYLDALNHYFREGEIDVIVDLFLRLYPLG